MSTFRTTLAALFLPLIATTSLAQSTASMKAHVLEDGQVTMVPSSMVPIPGQPVALSQRQLAEIEAVGKELATRGYVDRPNTRPIARNMLAFMRDEYEKKQRGESFDYDVNRLEDIPSSVPGSGISGVTEGYVMHGPSETLRALSSASHGDIYVNDLVGARFGVLGDSAPPEAISGDKVGYKTTVRYEGGKFATLFLIRTEDGVSLVEIGKRIDKIDNADTDVVLDSLLARKTDSN